MKITVLRSKIHRATVTDANLNYEGSITLDKDLMEKANIYEYEKVQIVNITNGNRFWTYIIKGEENQKGVVCLNGAAARLVQPNDLVIIMAYSEIEERYLNNYRPTKVTVDQDNQVIKDSSKII